VAPTPTIAQQKHEWRWDTNRTAPYSRPTTKKKSSMSRQLLAAATAKVATQRQFRFAAVQMHVTADKDVNLEHVKKVVSEGKEEQTSV
jgi:hypothetical protein